MKSHRKSLFTALASLTLAFGGMAFGATMTGSVTVEDLTTLANEVNLSAWTQITSGQQFTTIEESWVAVYSPKDEVGAAQNWGTQLSQARDLATRAKQPGQKRWLQLFIRAGEAVAQKDSTRFASAVRALGKEKSPAGPNLAANTNFFRAK